MTWFQKLLIAVPYLIYFTLFYLAKGSFAGTEIWDFIIFVFVGGFLFIAIPALVGFFIHLMFYQKISFTGGFIISHWFLLLVIAGWLTTIRVAPLFYKEATIAEPGYSIVYSGEKLDIEKIAKNYVRSTALKDESHVFYFLRMIKDTNTVETYTVYYFYNLSEKSDTAKANAIKMLVNAGGMVSFVERLTVNNNQVASNIFHNYYGFYEWLWGVTDLADKKPGTTMSISKSDSANLERWLRELDMTDIRNDSVL